ncbi:hypothetical protein [Actinopolymorpha cephalotaxi]|uniref:Uncharacterized protein n=1 Tax=Actinopolymorpha cephalotaxi TaxID=504797 RepID=A0ABX2SGG4_9ACTN|nr:hypothetical protein [Actinopolymorpha cephalotaxi]NYH87164.1 hypothetical protein [Actinopolymorpha cephalotaxi]
MGAARREAGVRRGPGRLRGPGGCCHVLDSTAPVRSDEHVDIGLFTVEEAARLPMPAGYLRSVRAWRKPDHGGTR